MPHSPELQPTASPLPTVSWDVMESVSANITENPDAIIGILDTMQEENPDLKQGMFGVAEYLSQGDTEQGNKILQAALLIYGCLHSQAVADLMNDSFLPPKQ